MPGYQVEEFKFKYVGKLRFDCYIKTESQKEFRVELDFKEPNKTHYSIEAVNSEGNLYRLTGLYGYKSEEHGEFELDYRICLDDLIDTCLSKCIDDEWENSITYDL